MLNLIKTIILLFLFLPFILYVFGVKPGVMAGTVEEKIKFPELSLISYRDGEFQKQSETWVLKNFPERKIFLKIYNTIHLTLFNNLSVKSRNGLIIGNDNFLFYRDDIYLLAYPHKHFTDEKAVENQVKIIKELQDMLTSNGTEVIAIISPNKVDAYEEKVPDRYKSNQNYFSLYYKSLIKSFKNEKLAYVDGVEIIKTRHKNYPNEALFTKGGYHWSDYGGCIVTRSLLLKVSKEKRQEGFEVPNCALDNQTQDYLTNDTARIVGAYNNAQFMTDYPSLLIYDKHEKVHFNKVILIGSSFSDQVKKALIALADIDEFYHFYYETLLESPYRPVSLEHIFDSADLVIIEELETAMSLTSTTNILKKYIDESKKNRNKNSNKFIVKEIR